METALLRYSVNFSGQSKTTAHHRSDGEIPRLKSIPGGSKDEWCAKVLSRRSVMASGFSLVSSTALGFPGEGLAVVKQGLLAGRVPGLSEPDDEGSCLSLFSLFVFLLETIMNNRLDYDLE